MHRGPLCVLLSLRSSLARPTVYGTCGLGRSAPRFRFAPVWRGPRCMGLAAWAAVHLAFASLRLGRGLRPMHEPKSRFACMNARKPSFQLMRTACCQHEKSPGMLFLTVIPGVLLSIANRQAAGCGIYTAGKPNGFLFRPGSNSPSFRH